MHDSYHIVMQLYRPLIYLFWLTHILIHPHAHHRTLTNTDTTTFCLLTQKTHDNTSRLQYRIQEQYKRKPTLWPSPLPSRVNLVTLGLLWAIRWKDHLPTFDLTRGLFYPRKTEYLYAVGLSRKTQQSLSRVVLCFRQHFDQLIKMLCPPWRLSKTPFWVRTPLLIQPERWPMLLQSNWKDIIMKHVEWFNI